MFVARMKIQGTSDVKEVEIRVEERTMLSNILRAARHGFASVVDKLRIRIWRIIIEDIGAVAEEYSSDKPTMHQKPFRPISLFPAALFINLTDSTLQKSACLSGSYNYSISPYCQQSHLSLPPILELIT